MLSHRQSTTTRSRAAMENSYLLTNGRIWTGDPAQPRAQAVVVRGADLIHAGTRDGADALTDAGH